ncbi:MAG: type II toxin-antitoxin system RelE/ParE family toxin [Chloroflexi bacterium]|nr:type II toxin-antitoxin system RelE/ParE family toxin [Chloroflexota bacterium]
MYRIELKHRAQQVLDRLPKTDFGRVVQAIRDLAETPRPRGMEKVKTTGLWRIRQGDYRIVYATDDNQQLVTIVRIGHRREVYRQL